MRCGHAVQPAQTPVYRVVFVEPGTRRVHRTYAFRVGCISGCHATRYRPLGVWIQDRGSPPLFGAQLDHNAPKVYVGEEA